MRNIFLGLLFFGCLFAIFAGGEAEGSSGTSTTPQTQQQQPAQTQTTAPAQTVPTDGVVPPELVGGWGVGYKFMEIAADGRGVYEGNDTYEVEWTISGNSIGIKGESLTATWALRDGKLYFSNIPTDISSSRYRVFWQQLHDMGALERFEVDPVFALFPGIPRHHFLIIPVTNAADWEGALITIAAASRDVYRAFVVRIDGDIAVPPVAYNLRMTQAEAAMIPSNPVSIALTGKGRLYLTSLGDLLRFDRGEHLIIDGDITLQGFTGGDTYGYSVISVSTMDHLQRAGTVTKVELRNGIITGNNSYGVTVRSRDQFIMSGGAIINNGWAGLHFYQGGIAEMSGGVISGNGKIAQLGKGMGHGVHLNMGGSFTMTGGTISGNGSDKGGGIYIYGGGALNISGGTVYGNDAPQADRNTATDGNSWGHAVFATHTRWTGDPTPDGDYYRDTTINPSDSLTGFNPAQFHQLIPASGQTRNGWTRR